MKYHQKIGPFLSGDHIVVQLVGRDGLEVRGRIPCFGVVAPRKRHLYLRQTSFDFFGNRGAPFPNVSLLDGRVIVDAVPQGFARNVHHQVFGPLGSVINDPDPKGCHL